MILRERNTGNEAIVGLEILCEFNKLKGLLPKFDMSISTYSDNKVSLCGRDDVVNGISMHVADFIEIRCWQTFEKQIMVFD